MNFHTFSRSILWTVLAATLFGGLSAYRFYRTTPELRFPQTETLWQLLPFGLLLLITIALLLIDQSSTPVGPSKTNRPH